MPTRKIEFLVRIKLGNVSVWFIILAVWQKRLRYHYFLMLNLSVADFLTGNHFIDNQYYI